MIHRTLLLFIITLFINSAYSATCNSVGNGIWNSTSNWSCGSIPSGGDIIVIASGTTITVTSTFTITGSAVVLKVLGTLDFQNGKKITLPAGSTIELTGSITGGGGGGSANLITIGTVDVWSSGDGNISGPVLLSESCTAAAPCVLPLTLTSFNAKFLEQDESVEITYTTSNEKNIDFYTIQRSSDAVNWEDLIDLKSQNDKNYNFYSYKDSEPLYSISYYRLKETDKDGSTTYFAMNAVNRGNKHLEIGIIPNPVTSCHFQINSNLESDITIYNVMGKPVHTQRLDIGANEIHVKLSDGIYTLKSSTTEGLETVKFIVQE